MGRSEQQSAVVEEQEEQMEQQQQQQQNVESITVRGGGKGAYAPSSSTTQLDGHGHGPVELVGEQGQDGRPSEHDAALATTAAELERRRGSRFGYLKRPQFWVVLALSQALAIANTGTSTLTTFLADEGTSVPAFQSLLNYALLNVVYTSYTLYRYGFRGWLRLVARDGWRYVLLAFCDVEGNYFTVLAYRYTTILSAQLINFWAIAVVVVVSLVVLRVRYHVFQYAGILIACGGLGMLVASDHITGANGGPAASPVKGDLFCLLGATFYGLTNVAEEFLVSKRPLYEVIGQLAFWATFINGVQAAIFDRAAFQSAVWNGAVGGYLTGYTLLLASFYSAVPVLLRMASAAFLNIGLLTGNFWGVVIGIKVFHYHIHWMYPIAFVLIIGGHFVYYGTEGVLGEAKKPWLGENQEGGSDGLGTARRQLEHPNAIV